MGALKQEQMKERGSPHFVSPSDCYEASKTMAFYLAAVPVIKSNDNIGTRQLNTMLQQVLNPLSSGKGELAHGGHMLRVGDRVIQQVNDYQREVFNGDMGTIASVDLEEQEIVVQFAERDVTYDYADLSELALAWAVTVHKSQGSEYPVVIFPVFMQHYLLLSRNLLYTGLTRAKHLAILVGPTKAIGLAVKRVLDRQRYTALADRLRNPSDHLSS